MEVRHERVDDAKPKPGIDEQRALARERRKRAAPGRRLERAHARRADGDDAPAARAAARDRRAELGRHAEPLRVQLVVLDALGAHRRERARADVQREERALDAARFERREQRRVEVQARGRRRDGARASARTPSGSARDRVASGARSMYGGSGISPCSRHSASASRSSVSSTKPSSRDRRARGRRPRARSPRRASACGSRAAARARGDRPSTRSSSSSTRPPLGVRVPARRAGSTRVSFKTSKSPARRRSGRSAKRRSSIAPLAPSSTSSRLALRSASGVCAISSRGRS